MKTHQAALAVTLLLSTVAHPAAAQADTTAGEHPEADVNEQVERYAREAFECTERAEYAEAIALYSRAYKLRPAATLLYNIAAIYDRRLNERELASEYYRRFLAAGDANPQLSERANRRLAEIREELAAAPEEAPSVEADSPTTEPPAAPDPPPVKEERNLARRWGVVLAGTGAVGIGVGLGLGAMAASRKSDANEHCDSSTCSAKGQDLLDKARTTANASTVTVALGSAFAAAGVTVLLTTKSKREQAAIQVRPGSSGSPLGFTLQRRF